MLPYLLGFNLLDSSKDNNYNFSMSNYNSRKFFAFTLAEVLITLTIIGIVAAITIPTILSNIQKKVLKEEIKNNYSMYAKIFTDIQYDYTLSRPAGLTSGYKNYNNELISKLKIAKVCKGNAMRDGCIPEDYNNLNVSVGCPGFAVDSISTTHNVYVLSDGSILIPYHTDWRSLWMVDVNGKKGPNKAGYDIYQMTLESKFEYHGANGCFVGDDKSLKGIIKNVKDIDKW